MRAFALALLLLVGCQAPPDHGLVTATYDVAAHDSTYMQPIAAGQTCFGTGTSRSCTTNFIYIPINQHYDRACYIRLRDDAGKEGDVALPCDQWTTVKVGDVIVPGQLR